MLKRMNKLRRSFRKDSSDKKEKKQQENKKSDTKKRKGLLLSVKDALGSSLTSQSLSDSMMTSDDQSNLTNLDESIATMNDSNDRSAGDYSRITMDNKNREDVSNLINEIDQDDSQELHRVCQSTQNDFVLPDTCTVLETNEGSKVYLVGTAHFSKESCKEVQEVIRHVQPNVLLLEICALRASLLFESEETLMESVKNFSWSNLNEFIRQQGLIQGVIRALFLYQAKAITKQLDVIPGSELRAAYFEAKKVPGCEIQLGDRPLEVTLKRVNALLSVWQKIRFVFTMIFSNNTITTEEMEQLKTKDMLEELINKMADSFAPIKQVLVDERDLVLAYNLQKAACRRPDSEFSAQAKKVNDSLASFLNCERRLTTCRNELENFKKVISDKHVDAQKEQLRIWEQKLYNLEQQYNSKQQQMLNEEEKLSIMKSRTNEDLFVPSVVVGIVGIGHVAGIVRNWNKVKESDIFPILEIPEESRASRIIKKSIKIAVYSVCAYAACRYLVPATAKGYIQKGSENLCGFVGDQTKLALSKIRK